MSWEELQKEQEMIYLQLKKFEKLTTQTQLLKDQLEVIENDIKDYNDQLQQTRQKLQKLDDFSFINLFRNWTGKNLQIKDETVEKAVAIELKLNESNRMKDDLEQDVEKKVEKMQSLNEPELKQRLSMIIVKKEVWLREHKPNEANQLKKLANDELNYKKLVIEIREAIEAGENAQDALYRAIESLHSASNYSAWDTFFGGGLIATHIKHEKLDESERFLHNAQIALQRFKNELLDVQEMDAKSLHVDASGFVKFADYFFDDIFSAWSIHSKIATSQEQVKKVIADVANTINKLKEKEKFIETNIAQIENERNKILAINDESLFL